MNSRCHKFQLLAGAALITGLCACNGGIGINPAISECGGFDTVARALAVDNPQCGDDVLRLVVDADNGVIHFTNENVSFNCCGDRDIKVDLEDGVYVVTETDGPVGGPHGGRCACDCLFDFAVDIPCTETNQISLRIVRVVKDEDDSTHVRFDDVVDISQGSAEVVIRTNVGWCY